MVIAWAVGQGFLSSATAATFTDVAAAVGISHVQSHAPGGHTMTGGAAAGDFDGDGLVDLFFTRVDGPDVLYRNTGSGFIDVSAAAGFTQSLQSNGVAAGDIDNDGDLDLYVTASEASRYYLFINDGAGRFTEEALNRGAAVQQVGDLTRKGQGVALGDYDRDGYLDILTSDHSRPAAASGSRLLRNLGAAGPGRFEDVTHAAGLDVYRQPLFGSLVSYRFQPQFSDIDRDGHTDVVFSSDARTSQLFWNNGDGTFTDGTTAAGVGTDKSGMGSALGDYDRDGDLDWFITAIFDTPILSTQPGNRLYRNDGNRRFSDVTTAAGVRESGWGWGTEFFDYDNDGWLDLMATDGFVSLGFSTDPTKLWRNRGDGTFADVSIAEGVTDTGDGRGLLTLDYDADGDLDVVVVNHAATPILYRNDGNGGHWLRVKTEGTVSNRDGIGAVVTVIADQSAPQAAQVREIIAGGGYLAQSEMTAHFGLGAHSDPIDLVTIRWPSGMEQRLAGVPVNSMLTVREPLPGDFNADGSVDAADLGLWTAQFGAASQPAASDCDLDGDVDGADFLAWQRRVQSAGLSNAWHVPEPAAPMVLAVAVLCGGRHVRREARGDRRRRAGRGSMRAIAVAAAGLASLMASAARAVDVWVTAGDKSRLLAQQPDVVFAPGVGSGGVQITVAPSITYQTIEGFGAAMTDSAAWLLEHRLSTAQRDKLMRQFFSPESGIGLNYLRVPMGASDFTASGYYTYNDNPAGGSDAAQAQFSVAHDDAYIVPRLQQARQFNPALKLMASPWTAPAWMKTNNSLTGGSLATQWEASYARYLAKFIKAYEDRGLPIDAVTVQNEPLHTSNYPTMAMSAAQQARLIGDHVGPHFAAEGVAAKIIGYDHNWDNPGYPLDVLGDAEARAYLDGVAFHAYAGEPSAQSAVHDAYPDKGIYFTEITGGAWATNFGDNLVWYGRNILIGNMRNWGKTAIMWNLALDQNSGPHLNGCGDCRGVVTINSTSGAVTFNEEFYALAHATKAIQPDAVRIGSTSTSAINTVALENPDGSRVLLALNPNATTASLRLYDNGRHFSYEMPGKSLVTFLWNDGGADFDNGGFDLGGYHQGGGSLDAWAAYGNAIGNVSAASQAVLDGDRSLKLFGQFSGQANASGVWQGVTVTPGDVVRADASVLVRSADSIAGTSNAAHMRIEFYSQYGAARGSAGFLGESSTLLADGATAADAWLPRGLAALAPDGAAEARLVLEFTQPASESGAVHIDGVSFTAAFAGDFNRDGTVDAADLDAWRSEFASPGLAAADGDADGDADGADFLIWQRQAAASSQAAHVSEPVPECSAPSLACLSGVALVATQRCGRPPARICCKRKLFCGR
ncbi:MAG: hypothetical protein DCC67_00870 [Planctomycetota bacterium]|nr:MAG: hypothetical protein DCC67_00870 [Planctomycetota bacterium]